MIDLPSISQLYADNLTRARAASADRIFGELVESFDPAEVPELTFPERSLGFEIEVIHDSCMNDKNVENAFVKLMEKLGLPYCIGKDESYQRWALTRDMTVPSPPDFRGLVNDNNGIEVVSPVLRTEKDKNDYVRVMAGLRHLGFYASDHCGSHVWFGLPEFQGLMDKSNVEGASDFVEAVGQSGPVLKDALGPHLRPSRHTTFFSGIPKSGRNWSWINLGGGQAIGERGKESMINMQHLVLRGALEFRVMGHTMDPVEIQKGVQVLEKCLKDAFASKPKRIEHAEFLVRQLGETRGPLSAAETRSALLQARWSNTTISVAVTETGERPIFQDGETFLFTEEAKRTGLREYFAPPTHVVEAYAKTIFSDFTYMEERPPEVVEATRRLDEGDRLALDEFIEKMPETPGSSVEI